MIKKKIEKHNKNLLQLSKYEQMKVINKQKIIKKMVLI